MEGVTTAEYRAVLRRHFPGVDKYFTPFLVANQTHHFKKREKRELLPLQRDLVPQILANSAEDFLWAARQLRALGYEEIDLNLGCPSATVVPKGKGAGMLAHPDRLERFFDSIFSETDLPHISVKTRLGIADPAEAPALGRILARYPFSEVIIHARVREDFYEGAPRKEAFAAMREELSCPVCYNGDIRSAEDADRIRAAFPDISRIMVGRGIVSAPWMAEELRGTICSEAASRGAQLKNFLDDLWETYRSSSLGERDVLFKMKELWYYLGQNYPEKARALLDLKKARTGQEYQSAVDAVLFGR